MPISEMLPLYEQTQTLTCVVDMPANRLKAYSDAYVHSILSDTPRRSEAAQTKRQNNSSSKSSAVSP
ncbi:hypothetical protein HYQ44_011210 [Verticillium longisporum]|nr:hypothetical protein HYQ44_011210 [Verticillium longisporum]